MAQESERRGVARRAAELRQPDVHARRLSQTRAALVAGIVALIGCGLEEQRRQDIDECCECLATTPLYDWQDPPEDYCWSGDSYEVRKSQCVDALDNSQDPYVDQECREQKCGGPCPMLND